MRRIHSVLLLSLTLIAAGCSSSDKDNEQSLPVSGGVLVDLQNFAGGEADHIDPALASQTQEQQIPELLFDGLTRTNSSGNLVNGAASSVEPSGDSKVWTFTLKKDATFTNGDPVLPSDFKFAWERVLNPALASPLAGNFSSIQGFADAKATNSLSGVVADDANYKLTVTLSYPFRDFQSLVSLPVFSPLPKKVFEGKGVFPEFETTSIVGNGPFKIKSAWEKGKSIFLARNDSYYGNKTYLNEVEFRVSKNIGSAYTDFEGGNGDVGRIPAGNYTAAVSKYSENVVNPPLLGTEYWGFNLNDPTVGGEANKKLRQAIGLAVDKQDLVTKIYDGARPVATGWTPPGIHGSDNKPETSKVPRKLDQAKQLMSEWGKPAPRIRVSFATGQGHEEKAALIASNLKDIGIDAVVDPLEPAAFRRAVGTGTIQFFRGNWNADFPAYDNFIYPQFVSSSIGSDNVFGYRNTDVDKWALEARSQEDASKSDELYRKAEGQVLSDQVIVPIDWTSASLVKAERVKDLAVSPLGFIAYDGVWVSS